MSTAIQKHALEMEGKKNTTFVAQQGNETNAQLREKIQQLQTLVTQQNDPRLRRMRCVNCGSSDHLIDSCAEKCKACGGRGICGGCHGECMIVKPVRPQYILNAIGKRIPEHLEVKVDAERAKRGLPLGPAREVHDAAPAPAAAPTAAPSGTQVMTAITDNTVRFMESF